MSAEQLRLILILIGAAILLLIWLLHKPEGKRRRLGARRREPNIDPSPGRPESPSSERAEPEQTRLPDLGEEFATPVEPAPASRPARRREPVLAVDPEPVPDPAKAVPDRGGSDPPGAAADQGLAPCIVTLYLRVRGQRKISGLSLLDAAIKAGLRFGEMKIFHRRHRGASRPVFSMANITRPGSFDPAGWNLFETQGVTLFMTLPGPVSALDAWDAMLATGQRLASMLDAELLDEAHCLLTRQRIAQIREQMRAFDRQHGLASGA